MVSHAKIIELYETGWSDATVGRAVGLSKPRILQIRKKYGVLAHRKKTKEVPCVICGKIRVVCALRSDTPKTCSKTCRLKAIRRTQAEHPKLYRAWQSMMQRCRNKRHRNYKNYGSRGIAVCPEWLDFDAFRAGVGEPTSPQHSIDRIDNDGNYEPGNVRWATAKEQANNRRKPARRR